MKANEILCYLRKSQSDDPALSVEEVLRKHENMLDEWAAVHLGEAVPESNKFREVISGESLSGRPMIQKVLRLIESSEYKAVLCVDPQRLTRGNLEDIGRLMRIFKLTNTKIITLDRTYDLSDDYDWDVFERELMRGNDYLKYVKKRLLAGRIASVKNGAYIGSRAPYGYIRTTEQDGKRSIPTLAPHPQESTVVRLIYDLYTNENLGTCAIARRLENMGIPAARSDKWSEASIDTILRNEVYIGKLRWNKRPTEESVKNGQFVSIRPRKQPGEYQIFDGRHEAIIPGELFDLAQEKHGKNARITADRELVNALAGLIFCHCGRAMIYRVYKKNGLDRCDPRLLCGDQVHCHTRSCKYSDMLGVVESALADAIHNFDIQFEQEPQPREEALIKSLENRLRELRKKEMLQWERQIDPDESARMPEDIFRALNAKLVKEKEKTQAAIDNLQRTIKTNAERQRLRVTFQEALDGLRDPSISPRIKNSLLKSCIEKIVYNGINDNVLDVEVFLKI